MCTVQLNGIKASGHRTSGTLDILIDQSWYFMFFNCTRWGTECAGDTGCRCQWWLVTLCVALGVLAPGMVQLHGNLRAFTVDRVDQVAECANEPVMVDSHRVTRGAPDLPIDRGILGDDQTNAASGAGSMVFDELIVNLTEGAGELSEDRCLHEAIAQLQGANTSGLVKRRGRAV
jgi:hypothetical protein